MPENIKTEMQPIEATQPEFVAPPPPSNEAELNFLRQSISEYQQQAQQYAQNNLILEKQVGVLRQRMLKLTEELVDEEVKVSLLNQQLEIYQNNR